MLKEGDKAPDFHLPDATGKTVSLKDFRGKKVVLYFYPKDLTSGCTKEACSFRDNISMVHKKGAEVIGVSADSVALHQKFIDTHDLPFPLLSDESKEMIKSYGVWQKKAFMGRKYMGIVRTTFVIDEKGVIRKIFSNVKVAGHTEAVLESL
ncbi:MAG TPA: thioredoxin-dependent thiol peroxidase [Bacteroidota bacterium]|nr:thioredoxin-dependent thiol peroxidase [Bacteroidota bacterium]